MAAITMKEILTKVTNVFKNDLYISDYKYIIGGLESEDRNVVQFLCVLSNEESELVKELFPDDRLVFISNVRKSKDAMDDYSNTKLSKEITNEITGRIERILKVISKVKEWKQFNFTDEELVDLFSDGNTIELFEDNDSIPSLTIGKPMFPLITEKNIDHLYYNNIKPEKEDGLYKLVTSIDTEWFQIYGITQYINIKEDA